jgi:hypothetical protein
MENYKNIIESKFEDLQVFFFLLKVQSTYNVFGGFIPLFRSLFCQTNKKLK